MARELNTYLPPVVVIPLGLLGNDASSEPQVSSDVQGPQGLLVPESDTDRFQSLPFTGNEEESVESAPAFMAPSAPRMPASSVLGGSVWDKRQVPRNEA